MQTIIFTCKTVTPLVMNGAYGDFPELRPPGIKASLRFWWRALHGHLSLDELSEQEGKIFGNTKSRSKVLIRVTAMIPEDRKAMTSLLPHKGGSEARGYTIGETFKIRIDVTENVISMEKLRHLFILACTLGGWGKRSRRGFGSVMVTEADGDVCIPPSSLQDILALLEKVVPSKHRINGNKIESNHVNQNSRDEYPKLWKIEIGSSRRSLVDIGKATHDTKFKDDTSPKKEDYSKSLGDGRPRYASPVYVSLLSNDLPIISTLKKQNRVNIDLQNKLKEKIL
jgi:CRISPR-associated protein Cmr1